MRHIALHAVCIRRRHLETCRIEFFARFIFRLRRCRVHAQALNHTAVSHEVAGVILEIQRAVFIDDRAAKRVLHLRRDWGKELIGGRVLRLFCIFIRRILRCRLTGLVAQDAKLAGGIVIEEVDVDIAVSGFFIRRGEKSTRLRVALRRRAVGNGHIGQVDDRDVMSRVGGELSLTGHADIGAAIVDDRCGGAHAAELQLLLVCQLPRAAALLHLHAVKISTLRGEVERLCRGIVAD